MYFDETVRASTLDTSLIRVVTASGIGQSSYTLKMQDSFPTSRRRDGVISRDASCRRGDAKMSKSDSDSESLAVARFRRRCRSLGSRMRSLAQGADTITWLALADAEQLEPGGLYLDRELQVSYHP